MFYILMIRSGLVQQNHGFGVYPSNYNSQNRTGPGPPTHEERPYVFSATPNLEKSNFVDPLKPENITSTERSINYHDLFASKPTDLTKQISDILSRTVGKLNAPGGGPRSGNGGAGSGPGGGGGGGSVYTGIPPSGAMGPSSQYMDPEETPGRTPDGGGVVNIPNMAALSTITSNILNSIIRNPTDHSTTEGLIALSLPVWVASPTIEMMRYLTTQQENLRRFVMDNTVIPIAGSAGSSLGTTGRAVLGAAASTQILDTGVNTIVMSVGQILFNNGASSITQFQDSIEAVLTNTGGEAFQAAGGAIQNKLITLVTAVLLYLGASIVDPRLPRHLHRLHRGEGGALRSLK